MAKLGLPHRSVERGMTVTIDDTGTHWTVLERHPLKGHWWLHRRDDQGVWKTTFARYTDMEQVIDA